MNVQLDLNHTTAQSLNVGDWFVIISPSFSENQRMSVWMKVLPDPTEMLVNCSKKHIVKVAHISLKEDIPKCSIIPIGNMITISEDTHVILLDTEDYTATLKEKIL